ncbi:MAG: hypothetical protein ACE15D_02085 [Candidatus Eisenbacteria bacterium]|nr:hypothetical protein [Candidatus Eisenbacteria bacterium]
MMTIVVTLCLAAILAFVGLLAGPPEIARASQALFLCALIFTAIALLFAPDRATEIKTRHRRS